MRAVVERADDLLRVQHLDVVAGLDLTGKHLAGPGCAQPHPLRPVAVHPQADALDVEHDVGNVLEHARQRGKLVQHALDLDRRDGGALQRGQQDAAQRVSERQPESAFERLGDDRRDALGIAAALDGKLLGFDQGLPILLKHDDLGR